MLAAAVVVSELVGLRAQVEMAVAELALKQQTLSERQGRPILAVAVAGARKAVDRALEPLEALES